MPAPTIAVVIPLYNKAAHIEAALASVMAQTQPADEILVVDDASTDDGPARVRALAHPRVRLLQREVPGPGGYAARNLAIREAKSAWIAFLDADDVWYPDHLQHIASLIADADAHTVGVFTGWERVWPDGRRRRDLYSAAQGRGVERTRLDFDQFLERWQALGTPPTWTSACAFRRDRLIEAGLFPEGRCRRGGDKDMWLRVMALGCALSDTRISAAYHQETDNQVTRVLGGGEPHCIWPTLEALAHGAPEARRRRLADLKQSDEFHDFRRAAKWERISPIIHPHGAGGTKGVLRRLALDALSRLPLRWQGELRALGRRGRMAGVPAGGGAAAQLRRMARNGRRALRTLLWRHAPAMFRAPHRLPGELVVSLTSYPPRFPTLHRTLASLLAQKTRADRVVLWIAHEDAAALPESVRRLESKGVTIGFCDDLRSYKKLLPTLERHPDAFVAIADDDVGYSPDWLQTLTRGYRDGERAAPCLRAHRITRTDEGAIAPYMQWEWDVQDARARAPSSNLVPTGIGGVLYPPGCLPPETRDVAAIRRLAPFGDDLWLYWMLRRNGWSFKKVGGVFRWTSWPGSQDSSLHSENMEGGRNDEQVAALLREYGDPAVDPSEGLPT